MANPRRTEEEITTGLLAVIAWAGNSNAASKSLKAEGKLGVTPATLKNWTVMYADRYDELREKYASQLEEHLIHDMRDAIGRTMEAEKLAVEAAVKRLEAGEDIDPARTAANLARVKQTNVDKMLSLSGRPTSIHETRNPEEIMRSLVSMGVLQLPDSAVKEIEEGTGG